VNVPALITAGAAAGGTLLLAFSRVFWSIALETEVYSLHALFLVLLLFLIVKTFFSRTCNQSQSPATTFPWLALLFFSSGLSFSNHMNTVLIIPALIYLASANRKWMHREKKWFLVLVVLFLCGLSLYAYLPIRAAQSPDLNWGNPQTWENFIWHITGRQYRIWMFSSPQAAMRQLDYCFTLLLKSFGIVPLLLLPFGVWYLFQRQPQMFWFTVIFFLTDILYAINYDINDIDTYFLPAFIILALWMASSLIFLCSMGYVKWKRVYPICGSSLCLMFLIPLLINYRDVDQRDNTLVEQYSFTILNTVQDHALLLSYQWDYLCSAAYYLQLVEKLRPDVVLIETQLLKRSWYIAQLKHNFSELMDRSREEVIAYEQELYKFEHGEHYDGEIIQHRYMNMINSFVNKNIGSRPIYVTCELEKGIGQGFERIPEGLVFRLSTEKKYTAFDISKVLLPKPTDFKLNDRLQLTLRSFYTFMLCQRALFERQFGYAEAARQLFQKALALDPRYPLAQKGLAKLS
jgi:hypothetical protein